MRPSSTRGVVNYSLVVRHKIILQCCELKIDSFRHYHANKSRGTENCAVHDGAEQHLAPFCPLVTGHEGRGLLDSMLVEANRRVAR